MLHIYSFDIYQVVYFYFMLIILILEAFSCKHRAKKEKRMRDKKILLVVLYFLFVIEICFVYIFPSTEEGEFDYLEVTWAVLKEMIVVASWTRRKVIPSNGKSMHKGVRKGKYCYRTYRFSKMNDVFWGVKVRGPLKEFKQAKKYSKKLMCYKSHSWHCEE